MSNSSQSNDQLAVKLDGIKLMLEDLFILQACRAGISQKDVRALLRIDITRVSRIAKHVKETD